MCGISGFLSFNKNFNESVESLKQITNRIKHRGPDATGYWTCVKDNIYLGHTRLSILDLSTNGNQPMISSCGRYVISFNGEIYNFREKSIKLVQEHNVKLSNKTDTLVLLELISKYGIEAAISQVEGMFAFAVWDRKEKKLHLARDRFGEKPLFYYRDKKFIIFGSELKVIKSFKQIDLRISKKASFYYSILGYIPAPHSIYENVFKVKPGEMIELRQDNSISKKIYYSPNLRTKNHKIDYIDFKKKVQNSLDESVKKMMVADVDVGCFLSGGVDSSLIALFMQKNSKKKIKTFTVGFNEKQYDESLYANQIARFLGTNHHQITVNSNDMLNHLDYLIDIFDEPFCDSSFIPTYLISKLAASHVKVVLSGDGGDEIFLGYNRYIFANRLLKFSNYCPNILRVLISKILRSVPSNFFDTVSQPFQKTFGIHALSHKIQKLSNILSFSKNSDFYAKLNIFDNEILVDSKMSSCDLFDKYEDIPLVESIQANDIDLYLPNDILVKVDRSSMANSLEVRSPFLDHILVDKVMEAPVNFKLRNNKTKFILKDILQGFTKDNFPYRPKMGFAIPIEKWINDKVFEKRISEIFYESNWSELGYNKKKLAKMWENFKKYKSVTPQCIWLYVVAGIWLEKK